MYYCQPLESIKDFIITFNNTNNIKIKYFSFLIKVNQIVTKLRNIKKKNNLSFVPFGAFLASWGALWHHRNMFQNCDYMYLGAQGATGCPKRHKKGTKDIKDKLFLLPNEGKEKQEERANTTSAKTHFWLQQGFHWI